MTLDQETKGAIDRRAEGRDIEQAFDLFIETITDDIMIDVDRPDDDDEASDMLDYMIEAVMKRFGYKFEGKECGVQVLTTDFDFAMASPGQDGKCKKLEGHTSNHDVREVVRGTI